MAKIERVAVEQTYPLRHEILRPHQPIGQCRYAGDHDPLTVHFAAYDAALQLGIVSVYPVSQPQLGEANGWQLRAMAVSEHAQGKGIGLQLLEAAQAYARHHGGRYLWANARLNAVGFYQRAGFIVQGDRFTIAGIGPHHLITKVLRESDNAL